MDAQLVLLLEIQEVRTKSREFRSGSELSELERQHFGMDPEEAATSLEAKAAELEESLDPQVRRRYDLIAGRVDRVVVPVINGTCYGCFVSIARTTALLTSPTWALS